jgi:hypothetical protein
MAWRPNEREVCPPEAKGKRVKVRLRCGRIDGDKSINGTAKPGWRADEEAFGIGPPMIWKKTGSPADVMEWDVV